MSKTFGGAVVSDGPFPLSDPALPEPGGRETHRLLIVGDDGAVATSLAFQFEQRSGTAGFQAVVFGLETDGPGASLPVVLTTTDVVLGRSWELRTSGLWAEQVRETSFEHWSYGLEAFALAIDEPDELVRRGFGHRLPLGWELDFVAVDPPTAAADHGSGSFDQWGTVDGLLLSRDGERALSGRARRTYWTGDRPCHSDLTDLDHSSQSQPGSVVLPTMWGPWTVRLSP